MYLRHNFGVSGRFSTDFIFTQKSWDTSETHFNIQKMKFLETKCYRFFADIQTCYQKKPRKISSFWLKTEKFFNKNDNLRAKAWEEVYQNKQKFSYSKINFVSLTGIIKW